MSKKNFDAFVSAAGKKKKPTPEEIEELSQILHQPAPPPAAPEPVLINKEEKTPRPEKQVFKLAPEKKAAAKPPVAKKAAAPAAKTAKSETQNPKSEIGPPARRIAGKEKVRVTIDLEKGLYQRLKMRVVVEETDLSTFVRGLLEGALG